MRVSKLFAITLGLLRPLAVVSCTTAKTQAPGEVVVVVTTDMVMPEDIDTLKWSVTVVGDETPLKNGSDSLDLGKQPLPATLAIAGPDTRGAVRIELDALRAGTPRVHREAQLTVPADGQVRQLAMPLDWLCTHDANPSLSCGAGQTCRGGECVPSAIEASGLPSYSAVDGGACFDMGNCFASPVGVFFAQKATVTGECKVLDHEFSPDVNVALVVATSQIGNYGACGVGASGGSCLIPLAHGAPEGWHTVAADGGAGTIGLPQGVCDDITSTLKGVVIARTTTSCPPKLRESPTCVPPDTCINNVSGVCPDLGPAWVGYTCSGSESPPGVRGCAAPPAAPDAGMGTGVGAAGARLCCALVDAGGQPSSDPLLIDDMSGGSYIKIAPPGGETAGFWWTASDDLNSPLVPRPLTFFIYAPVSPSLTPDGGPMNAACLTSPSGFSGHYAIEGFDFAHSSMLSTTGVPFDVSPYTGIRFWAWSQYAGQSIKVAFPDRNTETVDPTSTCNLNPDAGQCGNDWAIQNLFLTDVWTPYAIRWDQLTKAQGYGTPTLPFDAKGVLVTQFMVLGSGANHPYPPFEFCVSQIYFTQ
jgi:hypothetical protein